MKDALPWIIVGTGILGLGAILVIKNKNVVKYPSNLSPDVKNKVKAEIATSNDPTKLKQLANGLSKSGAIDEAVAALKKAADLTGLPQAVPGLPSMITPSPEAVVQASSPKTYKVVTGDIPGAIAKRFGVSLSALATANGANKARIMGGKINVGETLKLPAGAIDSGVASRAKGLAL